MIDGKIIFIIGAVLLAFVLFGGFGDENGGGFGGIGDIIFGKDAKYITCDIKLLNKLFFRVNLVDFQCTSVQRKCRVEGSVKPSNPISDEENDVQIWLSAGGSSKTQSAKIPEDKFPPYDFFKVINMEMCVPLETTRADIQVRDKDGIITDGEDSVSI